MPNSNNLNIPSANPRRKILFGVGLFSFFSLFSFSRLNIFSRKKDVIACAPEKETRMVRMLTQDGQLVEVEVSKLGETKGKATNQELQNWIKS
ncbi:hypothetical protein [Sediminibacterium sp.]|uniref:hypothetical protein n=1 Tax=Sediminibacterium sp. TaxID=1917865 RepID=UPI002732C88B|nr:hypothetical protein [Sediminibacterium sp.]MDP3394274.1 hypothetical protein [Sediminibacterium sp.]MDP3568109.1 hypothetical protein [Sediminibacterium sp.]